MHGCCSALPAGHYWLFHSVWHVLMAEGFHLLYCQLEGLHLQQGAGRAGRRRAPAPAAFFPVGAELFSEDEEEEHGPLDEEEEEEEEMGEEGAAVLAALESDDEEEMDPISSDVEEEEDEEEAASIDSEAESEHRASAAMGSRSPAPGAQGGLLHALLQPAARLVRYQRQQERLERRLSSRKEL